MGKCAEIANSMRNIICFKKISTISKHGQKPSQIGSKIDNYIENFCSPGFILRVFFVLFLGVEICTNVKIHTGGREGVD